mmetsp:Transcript_11061/g.18931  ORF Transcript_11061/g.18931 Transcript_11061/m.18931 type:complete len:82 (+) Transcript_11061:644-889(+)
MVSSLLCAFRTISVESGVRAWIVSKSPGFLWKDDDRKPMPSLSEEESVETSTSISVYLDSGTGTDTGTGTGTGTVFRVCAW